MCTSSIWDPKQAPAKTKHNLRAHARGPALGQFHIVPDLWWVYVRCQAFRCFCQKMSQSEPVRSPVSPIRTPGTKISRHQYVHFAPPRIYIRLYRYTARTMQTDSIWSAQRRVERRDGWAQFLLFSTAKGNFVPPCKLQAAPRE